MYYYNSLVVYVLQINVPKFLALLPCNFKYLSFFKNV